MSRPHISLVPFHQTGATAPELPSGAPYPLAAVHEEAACRECPQCEGLHTEAKRAAEDVTALTDPAAWAALEQALRDALTPYFQMGRRQIKVANDWWTFSFLRRMAIQDAIDDFWSDFGSLLDGTIDANKVSFTYREGWIPVSVTGLRFWVAGEEFIDEAMAAIQSSILTDQLGALNAEYNAALAENQAAEQAGKATKAFYDAEFATAQAWADGHVARFNDAVREAHQRSRRADIAWEQCLRTCRNPPPPEEDKPPIGVLAGAGLLIAGLITTITGQPFDTGSEAIAVGGGEVIEIVDEPAEQPAEPPADEPAEQPADEPTDAPPAANDAVVPPPEPEPVEVAPPDVSADEAMIDFAMQAYLGVTALAEDITPFLGDPTMPAKFALPGVDPAPRNSYHAETLTELGFDPMLGPMPAVTNAGTTLLTYQSPIADPHMAVMETYGPLVDIAIWPGERTSGPSPNLVAVGLTIDADLTDPAVCSNMEHEIALNVFDPNGPAPFVAGSSFPGDYYDGGNSFFGVRLQNCDTFYSFHNFMTPNGTLEFASTSPLGGLINVVDGTTHALVLVPDEFVPASASTYTVLFEHMSGGGFQPEYVRYQSMPDILGPPTAISDGVLTADCDFTLGPTLVRPSTTTSSSTTSTSTTTTTTTTTTTIATAGGGAPAPGGGDSGGTDTGGGGPLPGGGDSGGTGGAPTGGTDTGDTTTGDSGTLVPADPDDTRPTQVALGLMMTGAGAAAVASQTLTGRRRRSTGSAAAGGSTAPVPTGPPTDGAPATAGSTPQPGGTTAAAPPAAASTTPADGPTRAPTVPRAPAAGTGQTGDTQAAPAAGSQQSLERALEADETARTAATEAMVAHATANLETAQREYLSAVARYDARRSSEANEGALESLHDWWTGKDKTENRLLQRAATQVQEKLDAYRTAVSEYLAVQMLTSAPDDRAERLNELESANSTRRTELTTKARDAVEDAMMLDASDRRRSAILSRHKAELQTAAVFQEAIIITRTRLGIGATTVAKTLDGLASNIRDSRTQRERIAGAGKGAQWWEETEAHYRMREWLRDTERDLDIDTYIAVAEQASIVDETTGAPIADDLRMKAAASRLTWLSEYLQSAAWRRDDHRFTRAAELRERLATSYASIKYLGYGHVTMSEFFLATGQAIRARQDSVNQWFLSDYLGFKDYLGSEKGQDDGTWWRSAWASLNIGVGTSLRGLGIGDENIDVVKARIESMNRDADVAVLALQTAARYKDPNTWPTDSDETAKLPNGEEISLSNLRDLLESFGYITRDRQGTLHYRMPTTDTTVARATAIKLPGAPWLDVVSARNAGEVLLSVAIPELASVRIAAWVSRTGVAGARWATAVRILADQGIGFGMDVGFSYAKADASKRDLSRIAGESLVNNLAGLISRAGTDKLARLGASRFEAPAAVSRLLREPDTREAAFKVLSEALGIPGDALSQLVVQSASGHSVTTDDLLAALLGATMNRYLGRVSKGTLADPRVKRILVPEIHTEAMVIDRRLDDAASKAFDDAVGDAPMTAETGTTVFEALRRGDLSWEQLQRVYSSRGDSMDPMMNRVNDLRNELVASIGTRAREVARRDITDHYESLIAQAPDQATAERLRTEMRAELDLVADPLTEAGVAMQFTSDALDVQSMSRDELVAMLTAADSDFMTETRKTVDLGSQDLLALQALALRDLESRYVDAVRKAAGDEIAPGSAGATSDVDRSWSSEFLRRAARKVVLVEMTRGRIDGGTGPTTARAFDVNEYLNVMRYIPSIIKARAGFASNIVETITVTRPDGSTEQYGLSHADASEANSWASAMLHMEPERRAQFTANKTEHLSGAARTRAEAMVQRAERELATSESELRTYVERERQRRGPGETDSEIELRARDELYGDRMRQLELIGHEIDRTTDLARRGELMSQWELLMNRALRDGIETYSDMANLEIIVIRMQSQRGPNGEKLSPTDLMRSDKFALGTEALAGITAQQIRSMLNDQILMFMHHLHTLHTGHESPAKATRSLAKYAERALLALNLLGEFDPDAKGRYSDLFDATTALMRYKNNPKMLLETLSNLRPEHAGDTRANLRWYLDQLELIPGMAGLTREPPAGTRPRAYNETLAGREWMRERAGVEESGAEGSWHARVLGDLATVTRDLTDVEMELRTARALSEFRSQDVNEATRLLDEVAELEFLWTFTYSDRFVGEHFTTLNRDLRTRQARLEELKEVWRAAGRPGSDAVEARIARLEAERDRLRAHQQRLRGELPPQ